MPTPHIRNLPRVATGLALAVAAALGGCDDTLSQKLGADASAAAPAPWADAEAPGGDIGAGGETSRDADTQGLDVSQTPDADAFGGLPDAFGGETDFGATGKDAVVGAADGSTDAAPAPDATAVPACPPAGAPQEIPVGGGFTGEARCGPLNYFAVVGPGVELHLSARDVPPGAEVIVTDPLGTDLGRERADERGVFSLQVTTVRAGELRWTIATGPDSADTNVRGSLVCVDGCDREATRYPIVLMHGMAGTDRYFGLLDYFYDIVPLLSGRGFAAFTPVVPPIGSSSDRADVLAPQIDAVLAETGAAKVHLIAHSQGGLDARILVSGLGYADRVASITTLSSPHAGIPIDIPEWLAGEDFSREAMAAFALQYPDVEAMPRFSWAGRTCGRLEGACREANQDEVVELVLGASHALMSAAAADDGDHGENDGVVLVSSARWGEFLGIVPADHFDEVGQIADAAPAPFDHRGFYLSEARRLRALEQALGL
jgi:pimeloyl-ACP methyl ester carboxylesterase